MSESVAENAEMTVKSALLALASRRSLLRVLITLACFELVARVAPWIIPRTVHQPFLSSVRHVDALTDGEGKRAVTWTANERGARGSLFRDEVRDVAVFGSSTTAGTFLDQPEAWPARVGASLPCTHVDNYARDGATMSDATRILEYFAAEGKRYEAVIIMQHGDPRNVTLADALQFWGRWHSSSALQGPSQAAKHARLQVAKEARLMTIAGWLKPSRADRLDPNDLRNWAYRQTSSLRFVYEPRTLTATEETQIRRRAHELFASARKAADRVSFVTQPIGYDEHELPEVGRRWYSLYPATTVAGAYLDNRSVAEQVRAATAVIVEVARQSGVQVVPLDEHVRPMLRARGDLFLDKWHFSRHGAAVAAQKIAAELSAAGLDCSDAQTSR